MILTCLVVDDEEHAVDKLSNYIKKTPGLKLIEAYTNPLEALDKINAHILEPDIVFLDVDMPQISGMDMAKLFPEKIQIIFATGFSKYAIKAFEEEALDYLLKPITYERFLKSISRAKEKLSLKGAIKNDKYFFIQSEAKGNFIKIQYEDIIYIEAATNYVNIHKEGDDKESKLLTYFTLTELMDKLPEDMFMRIHKSSIVNLHKVKALRDKKLIMINDEEIAIGHAYNEKVLKFIHSTLFKSKRKT